MIKDRSLGSRILDIVVYAFCAFALFICIFPFINILAISISGNVPIMQGKVTFWPKAPTFEAYKRILSSALVPRAFLNSVIYTVLSTAYSVVITTMLAYPLSKEKFFARKFIWIFVLITCYFSGGLIPLFLLVNKLHMYNSVWSMVFPCAIAMYCLLLMKTFIKDIPASLEESAMLDGANQVTIFMKIILPLMKPAIATITLHYAVWKWNDFFNPLIYFSDYEKLPLTVILRDIVISADTGKLMRNRDTNEAVKMAFQTRTQYATLIISMIPIFLIYPLIQRYFVSGVTTGAVKE